MSSDGSSSSNETKQCILNCKGAQNFYNLPNKVALQKTWLCNLGIDADDFYPNPWVCDKHFSNKMFAKRNVLYQHAVPDQNLPKPKAPPQSTVNEGSVQNSTMGKKNAKRTDISNFELNDTSNILVDYQLRLQGKHVCDVIEIPQFVVVFTVIKAKQKKKIHLDDLKSSKKKPGGKKPSIHSEVITIDDDIDDIPENIVQEADHQDVLQAEPSATIQSSTPVINQPQDSAIIQSQPELQQTVFHPSCQSKSEIHIVYYTAEDALPRRERSVQVDLTSKKETAIQCDVQLDNDIMEIAYNAELYWVQSCFRTANLQNNNNMHECLICGEIVSNNASKVRHAHVHETTPSLCSQCGVMFKNQMKLRDHIQTFHTQNSTLRKPQRCPIRNCFKAFHSKEQLSKHIKQHMQTKRHKCNKCLQFFNSSLKLICHQRALDKCLRTRGWTSRRWSKRT